MGPAATADPDLVDKVLEGVRAMSSADPAPSGTTEPVAALFEAVEQGAPLPDVVAKTQPVPQPHTTTHGSHQRTLLHVASDKGHSHLVPHLLTTLQVDKDAQDAAGDTALTLAAARGDVALTELLLSHGASHSLRTRAGSYALHAGVASGEVAVVTALLGAGADAAADAYTPALNMACTVIDPAAAVQMVEALLAAGADPTAKDHYGFRPVEVAAKVGCRPLVEALIPHTPGVGEAGAGVDSVMEQLAAQASEQAQSAAGAEPQPTEQAPGKITVTIAAPVEPDDAAAADRAREGNAKFVAKDYPASEALYTASLRHATRNATVWSNRAAARLRMGDAEGALGDARRARALKPDSAKAWFREGSALRQMKQYEAAANALYEACMLDEKNDMSAALRECVAEGRAAFLAAQQRPSA